MRLHCIDTVLITLLRSIENIRARAFLAKFEIVLVALLNQFGKMFSDAALIDIGAVLRPTLFDPGILAVVLLIDPRLVGGSDLRDIGPAVFAIRPRDDDELGRRTAIAGIAVLASVTAIAVARVAGALARPATARVARRGLAVLGMEMAMPTSDCEGQRGRKG